MQRIFWILAVLFSCSGPVTVLFAEDAVPPEYGDLYASLEQNLLTFEGTLDAAWNGVPGDTAFTASLSTANAHLGLDLLRPDALNGVLAELDGLRAMGVQAAFISIPYPVLYQPFHTQPGEYETLLGFYRNVAQAVRDRGMGLVIETGVLVTEDPYCRWPTGSLDGFYNLGGNPDFDLAAFNLGRATVAETLAKELAPDYLIVMNEPDVAAEMTGISELNDVAGARQSLDIILASLQDERLQGLKVGAGIGSWQAGYSEFVSSFVQAPMDFFDIHVFVSNSGFLDRLLEIADLASAAGMPVSVAQAWLMKSRDAEILDPPSFPRALLFSRDVFSFWSPLDCHFAQVMAKYSHLKRLEFISLFWSRYLRAYLPYDDTTNNLSPEERTSLSIQAAATAHRNGQFTDTGRCYEAAILGRPDTIPPNPPLAPSAKLASPASVYIEWANGVDNVGVAAYELYRNGQKVATTIRTGYMDQGLEEATSYSYRIVAFDAFGNYSAPSPATTVTTPDVTAPTDPAGLAATAMSETEVSLYWNPSTDNVGVTGYLVYRGMAPDNLVQLAFVAGPSFTESSLPKDTIFYYAVQAVDAAHNVSAVSPPVSVATLPDTTPPSVPAGLTVNALSISELRLTWTPSEDNIALAGYRVYLGQSPNQLTLAGFVTSAGFTQKNLSPNVTLYFAVDAADSSLNFSSRSAIASGTTLSDDEAPSLPAGVNATGVSENRIDITWAASTDNFKIHGYKIFRSSDGSNFILIGYSTTTSWSNMNLPAGYTFYYSIEAIDMSGNGSGRTSVVTAATLRNQTPPTKPANLTAVAVSDRQINLAWGGSQDDTGVAGYKIYRQTGAEPMILIGFTKATAWSNMNLPPNTAFTYAVEAIDINNNPSQMSNPAVATTHVSPDTGNPTAVVLRPAAGTTISGSAFAIAAWGEDVQRSLWDTPSGISRLDILIDGVVVGQVQGTQGYILFDTRTLVNGPHTITVIAWDNAGHSGASNAVSVVVQN